MITKTKTRKGTKNKFHFILFKRANKQGVGGCFVAVIKTHAPDKEIIIIS